MGADQVLLGNLNPVTTVLNSNPEFIFKSLAQCHATAGARYIIGAGCEIPRDTPRENVRTFAEYARNTEPRQHAAALR